MLLFFFVVHIESMSLCTALHSSSRRHSSSTAATAKDESEMRLEKLGATAHSKTYYYEASITKNGKPLGDNDMYKNRCRLPRKEMRPESKFHTQHVSPFWSFEFLMNLQTKLRNTPYIFYAFFVQLISFLGNKTGYITDSWDRNRSRVHRDRHEPKKEMKPNERIGYCTE